MSGIISTAGCEASSKVSCATKILPHEASQCSTSPTENKNLKDDAEIEKAIKLGEYIRNGTLILIVFRRLPNSHNYLLQRPSHYIP